jgi:predicted  nucleic acid-binding Zn-ribbon protein
MRIWIYSFCFCFGFLALQADESSSNNAAAAQAAYQQLVSVDEQIENLVKQKLQLKEEIAAHTERGSTALLPGAGRRQDREIEELMQQMQTLNQQMMSLEEKRSQILLALD